MLPTNGHFVIMGVCSLVSVIAGHGGGGRGGGGNNGGGYGNPGNNGGYNNNGGFGNNNGGGGGGRNCNGPKLNALSRELALPNMCYGNELQQTVDSLQSVLRILQSECLDLVRDVEQFRNSGRKKTAEQKIRNRVQVFEIRTNQLMYPVRGRVKSGRLACEQRRNDELTVYKAMETFLDNYCQIPKMLSCLVDNCQNNGGNWDYWGVNNFSNKQQNNGRRY